MLQKTQAFLIKYSSEVILFSFIFILYGLMLPQHVQGGDTGELVTNAYLFHISHPPGYPLYHLLYGFFIHLFPFKSIFFSASLLTSLQSIIVLIFFYILCAKIHKIFAVCFTLSVAFFELYWRLSLLPDVFMLHAVFCSLTIFFYLQKHKYSNHIVAAAFILGMSNHHSIIFLLPIFVDNYLQSTQKKNLNKVIIFSSALCLGLYLSLFKFNTSALHSWGNLISWHDLWVHFIRADYGSFQLSANANNNYFGSIMLFFLQASALVPTLTLFTTILGIFTLYQKQFSRIHINLTISLGLYIFIFFSLANIYPEKFGASVLERFLLMPFLLLCFLCLSLLKTTYTQNLSKIILTLSIILMTLTLHMFPTNLKRNNFSKNSIYEDYAVNLLNSSEQEKLILVVESDSIYGSLLYSQQILQQKPNTKIILPSLIIHDWYRTKIQQYISDLEIQANLDNTISIQQQIIDPNIKNYSFILHRNYEWLANGYKLTIKPSGFIIESGNGLQFSSQKIQLRQAESLLTELPRQYREEKQIFAQYAKYYLLQGIQHWRQQNNLLAKKAFEEAVALVPYCTPAILNLCLLVQQNNKSTNCEQLNQSLQQNFYPYF